MAPQRIVRTYHIEATSNGYSLRILGDQPEQPGGDPEVAHFVVGGFRSKTKPETLRKKLMGYALGELKEQFEQAIEQADMLRPELDLPADAPATDEA